MYNNKNSNCNIATVYTVYQLEGHFVPISQKAVLKQSNGVFVSLFYNNVNHCIIENDSVLKVSSDIKRSL